MADLVHSARFWAAGFPRRVETARTALGGSCTREDCDSVALSLIYLSPFQFLSSFCFLVDEELQVRGVKRTPAAECRPSEERGCSVNLAVYLLSTPARGGGDVSAPVCTNPVGPVRAGHGIRARGGASASSLDRSPVCEIPSTPTPEVAQQISVCVLIAATVFPLQA